MINFHSGIPFAIKRFNVSSGKDEHILLDKLLSYVDDPVCLGCGTYLFDVDVVRHADDCPEVKKYDAQCFRI